MNEYLKGKKILFIAPVFNDYEKHIISELEDRGAVVHFFGEKLQRLHIHSLFKFKLYSDWYDIFQKKYLEKIS